MFQTFWNVSSDFLLDRHHIRLIRLTPHTHTQKCHDHPSSLLPPFFQVSPVPSAAPLSPLGAPSLTPALGAPPAAAADAKAATPLMRWSAPGTSLRGGLEGGEKSILPMGLNQVQPPTNPPTGTDGPPSSPVDRTSIQCRSGGCGCGCGVGS